MTTCDCDARIAFYETNLALVKLVHKYLHDEDIDLPWRPRPSTSIDALIKRTREMRALLGSEVCDEITETAGLLKTCLENLQA